MRSGHKLIYGIVLGLMFAVPVFAQDFTQGFGADEKLLRGAVVSKTEDDENKVEGSTAEFADRMHGVVVRSNESPVILTYDTSGVLVATSGRYEVLVSNVNGEIQAGDYITASPIKGVAMKADDRQPKSLGRAMAAFDTEDQNQVLATEEVTTREGQQRTVAIGRVLTDLDVRNNPLAFGIQAPQVLIKLGETIAGGPVSVTRIWGAFGTLVLSLQPVASFFTPVYGRV